MAARKWIWHPKARAELSPCIESITRRALDTYGQLFANMDIVQDKGKHPEEERRLTVRAFPATSNQRPAT